MPEQAPSGKPRGHATHTATLVPGLVRQMLSNAQQAREAGKKTAYTFICSAYDEIVRAMDIVPIWVENFAGVCGAKRVANQYLEKAETGFLSRTMCTYALCGLGFDALREESGRIPPGAPWGGMPRPDMMLGTGAMICDPRHKWFQQAQQYMPDVPVSHTNILWPPFQQNIDHREVEQSYVKYMRDELRSLVAFLEKQTGHKMDWARLSELVDLSDRTWNLCWETHELRRAKPAPMGTGDAFNTMVPLNFMLGTREAYDFFLSLNRELKERIAAGSGSSKEEKYRLLWGGGLAAWFALNDFDYFSEKGASFPVEISYRLAEPVYKLDLPPTSDPLEHLAWRWTRYWTAWYQAARRRPGSYPEVERMIEYIEDYAIDGVVVHEAFSCRTWHPGLLNQLVTLKQVYRDIPTLVLESDMVDIGSYDEGETRRRIDNFVELLEEKRGR
jgi:benzoyl-CoA reductase/2-hydroxyglutaryl-CoA dehydratase subunit BcrC/BadD/HgdB